MNIGISKANKDLLMNTNLYAHSGALGTAWSLRQTSLLRPDFIEVDSRCPVVLSQYPIFDHR
ncbi:MAG TPA: hypothetical protein VJ869_06850 [Sphaerochaeta sp.]|nr:hypothetical protein [Sphaerochaeta sp.]